MGDEHHPAKILLCFLTVSLWIDSHSGTATSKGTADTVLRFPSSELIDLPLGGDRSDPIAHAVLSTTQRALALRNREGGRLGCTSAPSLWSHLGSLGQRKESLGRESRTRVRRASGSQKLFLVRVVGSGSIAEPWFSHLQNGEGIPW